MSKKASKTDDKQPDRAKKLRPRQAVFVAEYLKTLNAHKAAIAAGYSAKTAWKIGTENLQKLAIQEAITAAMAERASSCRIDAEYVLNKIRDTVERCSQAEPVLDRLGNETGEWRFDSNGVLKGCELLGKHLGMFKDGAGLVGVALPALVIKIIE